MLPGFAVLSWGSSPDLFLQFQLLNHGKNTTISIIFRRVGITKAWNHGARTTCRIRNEKVKIPHVLQCC